MSIFRPRWPLALLGLFAFVDCAGKSSTQGTGTELGGPQACVAAGGECVVGGGLGCAQIGPQDCNPERNPGGAVCCLQRGCPDGGPLVIEATSYDQSCQASSDCVDVSVGDVCGTCFGCQQAPINVRDQARHDADVQALQAGYMPGNICDCVAPPIVCCVAGACVPCPLR